MVPLLIQPDTSLAFTALRMIRKSVLDGRPRLHGLGRGFRWGLMGLGIKHVGVATR